MQKSSCFIQTIQSALLPKDADLKVQTDFRLFSKNKTKCLRQNGGMNTDLYINSKIFAFRVYKQQLRKLLHKMYHLFGLVTWA